MPTTNVFFNNFNATGEQNLLHDLIIESIKIYGHEVYYMPRSIVAQSNVFGEDLLSKFEDAHPIEMYIKNVDSDGNRIARPAEGDLLYFPLNGKMFEVKFVEHEAVFYQMGSLQTYDLRCELFDYSHESIDTGIGVIDAIEDDLSSNALNFQILDEAGNIFILEDGSSLVQEGYRLENTDNTANNEFFGASTNIDFMDFSEGNPFSEGNN